VANYVVQAAPFLRSLLPNALAKLQANETGARPLGSAIRRSLVSFSVRWRARTHSDRGHDNDAERARPSARSLQSRNREGTRGLSREASPYPIRTDPVAHFETVDFCSAMQSCATKHLRFIVVEDRIHEIFAFGKALRAARQKLPSLIQ
jgi:hypothetical protein